MAEELDMSFQRVDAVLAELLTPQRR